MHSMPGTFQSVKKVRLQSLCICFVGADDSVRPAECSFFSRKAAAHTRGAAHLCVGADAHIGPAEYSVFTVFFGEFETSKRADVGIGPYSQTGKCNSNSPKGFVFAAICCGRTESSAPTQTLKILHKKREQQFFDTLQSPRHAQHAGGFRCYAPQPWISRESSAS